MENVIRAGASQLHGFEIEDISFAKINGFENAREIIFFAGGKIVYSPDLLAAAQELARQRGPNETADACDQVQSHGPT
jgi:hypothetical protein